MAEQVSQQQLSRFVHACEEVFAQHGITIPGPKHENPFRELLRDLFFDFIGQEVAEDTPEALPLQPTLTIEQLNAITRQCAQELLVHCDIRLAYNEEMNALRGAMEDYLESIGVTMPHFGGHTVWFASSSP